MSAELRKLFSLPTPRWTAVAVFACMMIGVVIVFFTGSGSEPGGAVAVSMAIPLWIASIVIGAWMIGLEYGQKTMRRTLSADPSRLRLLACKLVVVCGYVLVLTAVITVLGGILFSLAASHGGGSIPFSGTLKVSAGGLAQSLVYACVGFFLALMTRSMAGGMTVALAFAFIIDTALSAIPAVGDYSLSFATTEIYGAIAGASIAGLDGEPELLKGIALVAAWLVVFGLASGLRFVRTDVD